MIIYAYDGTPILSIKVDDSSYKYEEIMGDCNVYLEFALTQHIEIEPGSYIMFQGVKYELLSRENVTIQHTRNYEYKATFRGPQARFSRYIMYNYQDGRVKFEMIAKPNTLLEMVLWNLNNREPGVWTMGSYVDKEEQLVSFNHTNLLDALNIIAEAFDTEWSVEPYGGGYRINLRKNEFNKSNPLALGYGKDQGFKPGVGRLNYGDFGQVEKVWIEGGDRNLSLEEYGWTTLHFPPSFSFSIDAAGRFFYWVGPVWYRENGYDSSSALDFVTDEFGASVKLASANNNCVEASLDLTEYYPKRIGTVTDVRYLYNGQYMLFNELISLDDIDWNAVQVDIIDATIGDSGLDYNECQFSNDEPLTVIFQSGMLMGREFNATFVKEPKYRPVIDPETGQVVIDPTTGEPEMVLERPGNRFELSRATIDGVDMPNYTFRPNATMDGGVLHQDTFIVVNCWLPQEYVRDYDNFSGAEIDALREAAKFIRDNKDPQFTFKGQVDDLYAQRNWGSIHDKLILGGCISFQNSSIQPAPIVTRILGIKTFVNKPYSPELTLSNETVRGGMSSKLAKLRADDEHIIEGVKQARRYAQRSFRDAKETIAMLAGTIDYFSEGINPITVETMSLLVGYEALQFRFFTDRSCNTNADPVYHYDSNARTFTLDACVIQHLTHGINDITSAASPNGTPVRKFFDFLRWSMAGIVFGPTYFIGVDPVTGKSLADTPYYLYAKVDALNVAKMDSEMTEEEAAHIGGEFVLTTEKKPIKEKLTAVDGYYYLLVGILNSEYDGNRSFAPLFGFTEILPGQITTNVIRSSGGDSFFDLVNNQFQLGQSLKFINNELVLNGAFVQSGDRKYHLGAFRGQWTAGEQYSEGDEVWWQAPDGTISSYIYVNELPTIADANNDPSHPSYWQVYAQGVIGGNGQSSYKSTIFCRTNEEPVAPASSVGSFAEPAPPTPTAWRVYDEDGYVISGVYWSDGIPEGDEILWATTRIFSDDGRSPQQASWAPPRPMTDTSEYDVEFALEQPNGATPADPTYGSGGSIDSRGTGNNRNDGWYGSYSQAASHGVIWFDQDIDHNLSGLDWTKMVWRAERWMRNGEWGQWAITQIKGEKGEEGNGIADIEEFYEFAASGTTPPDTWTWGPRKQAGLRPTQEDILGHAGFYLWTKTVISYTNASKPDKVITSAQYLPTSGADGPMIVSRGKYNRDDQGNLDPSGGNQTYYGNDKRRDAIWYDNGSTGRWYLALDVREETQSEDGAFSGIAPDSPATAQHSAGTAYWSPFEGSFANVATGLMLAEKAFIDKAVVGYLQTSDTNTDAKILAEKNWLTLYDNDGVERFNLTGDEVSVGTPVSTYSIPTYGQIRRHKTASGTDSFSYDLVEHIDVNQGNTLYVPSFSVESEIDNGSANTYVYIKLKKSGTTIDTRTVHISGSGSGTASSITVENASAGTYTLVVEVSVSYTVPSSLPMQIFTVNATPNGAVRVSGNTAQKVIIGANGFVAHLGNGFSAILATDPDDNDSPKILLQGIKNGQAIGLRIDGTNGVQIKRETDSTWQDL